jgi:hypothetical protein
MVIMDRGRCVHLAWVLPIVVVVCGGAIGRSNPQSANPSRLGIAIVPRMADALPPRDLATKEQNAERDMYEVAGQMSQIDRIFVAKDGDDAFRLLTRVQRLGRPIWFVSIMGHGSSERPFVELADGAILPDEVDLAKKRQDLHRFQDIRETNDREGRQTEVATTHIRDLTANIERLEAVSLKMPANAVLLLVNCFASKGPAGEQFTRQLGEIVVGAHGGHVIASRDLIKARLVVNVAQMLTTWWTGGDWQPFGGLGMTGDWVVVPIPPRGIVTALWHDASGATCDLVQSGSKVTGTVAGGDGHFRLRGAIEGTIQGNTIRGTYTQKEDRAEVGGALTLSLSADQKLEGQVLCTNGTTMPLRFMRQGS